MKNSAADSLRFHFLILIFSLVVTAGFYAAALQIPRASRFFFQNVFVEEISPRNIPRLLERRERLEEVRAYLDERVNSYDVLALEYAQRGQVEALLYGAEAGFVYLLDLLRVHSPAEMTEPWVELARLAGEAGRWEDFFNLCLFLNDYGKRDDVALLIRGLQTAHSGLRAALLSPTGLKFLVDSGLDAVVPIQLSEAQAREKAYLSFWRARKDLDDGKLDAPVDWGELTRTLPDDPRIAWLANSVQTVPKPALLFGRAPDLSYTGFFLGQSRLESRTVSGHVSVVGSLLAGASGDVWLCYSARPLLRVFPLVAVDLNGEVFVKYLSSERPFPTKLNTDNLREMGEIRLTLLNYNSNDEINQKRAFDLLGVWVKR